MFAQVGNTAHPPRHIGWAETLDSTEFRRLFDGADLIVAHAGMGTILSALERGRPLVVVPRRADLREHRNDHQLATVRRLAELGLVTVADDERQLVRMLDEGVGATPTRRIGESADPALIERVATAIARTRGHPPAS